MDEQKSKAALRMARFRDTNGVQGLTVNLPVEVLAAFQKHCIDKSLRKSDVIEKLIRTQLLRKR